MIEIQPFSCQLRRCYIWLNHRPLATYTRQQLHWKEQGRVVFGNRFSAALSVSAVAGTWALQPERSCCWTNGGPNEPLSFLLLVFFQQSCRSTSERNLVSSGEIMCIKLSRIKTLTWFPVINTISSLIKALYLISSKWKEEKHSKM